MVRHLGIGREHLEPLALPIRRDEGRRAKRLRKLESENARLRLRRSADVPSPFRLEWFSQCPGSSMMGPITHPA